MHNPKMRLTVRLLLEQKGQVLLLLQSDSNGGSYTLPGGKIDEGELPVEALIRESQEETGIQLRKKKVKLVHILQRQRPEERDEIILFYRAHKWEGKIKTREPNKFANTIWQPMHQLPSNTLPHIKQAIQAYINGELYSEANTVTQTI